MAKDFRSEFLYTLRLGVPLALGELGWMSTYIVDALMIGRLPNSPLAISASSLGNTIFYAIVFCAIFLMNGLETLVAQAYGQNDRKECLHILAQSFWFVVVGSPLVIGLTLASLYLLPYFGTQPEIIAETSRYLRPLVWSTLPLMSYMALRRFLQSIDNVAWVTASLVTAALVNWFGDWLFLYGHFGLRPMGIAGSAWGTVAVRIYMLVLLLAGTLVATKQLGERFQWTMLRPNRRVLRTLFAIGWPSGLQELEELGVSTYLSILCARLGSILLAAHQVVLDLNAFVYQIPAGLSYATVVRVGQSAGRRNAAEVRRAATVSLVIGLAFMVVAALVFAGFSHLWASLYTNSEAVMIAAGPIFTICGFLLIADTTFVVLSSALTGIGDTRTPMIASIFWNWGIGMPVAFLLAFHRGMALRGLWIGRAAGSIGAAITLTAFWWVRSRREVLPSVSTIQGVETLPVCGD